MAYFISDVVEELDLSVIMACYEGEDRGGPPYHPRMLVKVLLYGYCTGVASSRRIARCLHEDIAFRVLAANNTLDFRTISDFRQEHLEALSGLFVQVLELCQKAETGWPRSRRSKPNPSSVARRRRPSMVRCQRRAAAARGAA